MTQVDEAGQLGYFGDPYPIHQTPWTAPFLPQYFSGTTQEILKCKRPIEPGCFQAASLTVNLNGEIQAALDEAGTSVFDKINDNIFQASDGS